MCARVSANKVNRFSGGKISTRKKNSEKTYEIEFLIKRRGIRVFPEVLDPRRELALFEHVVKGDIEQHVAVDKGLDPLRGPVECEDVEIVCE